MTSLDDDGLAVLCDVLPGLLVVGDGDRAAVGRDHGVSDGAAFNLSSLGLASAIYRDGVTPVHDLGPALAAGDLGGHRGGLGGAH